MRLSKFPVTHLPTYCSFSTTLFLTGRQLYTSCAWASPRLSRRAISQSKMLASPLLPSPRFADETTYKPAKDLEAFNKLLPPPIEFVEGSSSGVLAAVEGKYIPINEGPKSAAPVVSVSLFPWASPALRAQYLWYSLLNPDKLLHRCRRTRNLASCPKTLRRRSTMGPLRPNGPRVRRLALG